MSSNLAKCLLIESDLNDVRLMMNLLSESSSPRLETQQVGTLTEALSRLQKEKFDIILLNLFLQDSGGVHTLEKIITKSSQAPVIVINGADDERLIKEAMRVGSQDYWTKGQVGARFITRSIGLALERAKSAAKLSGASSITPNNPDTLKSKQSDVVGSLPGARRERVLVAEDEEEVLQIILNRLNKLGFLDVVSVSNGMEAYNTCIAKLNLQRSFDLIISDWKMPRLSGLEFLTKVRGNIHLKDIPFMMITGMDERDHVKEAAGQRVSEYLVKPFKLEDFDRKIEGLLRSSKKN